MGPVHKVVWVSPPEAGDVYKIFAGQAPFFQEAFDLFTCSQTTKKPKYSHSSLCNCLPSLSLSLEAELVLVPNPSPSSQAGCSGPRVLPGDHKWINWCFVLFFSFPEKFFPFENMGTIVAFPPSGTSVCHVFSKIIAECFAVTLVSDTLRLTLGWLEYTHLQTALPLWSLSWQQLSHLWETILVLVSDYS